MAATAVKSRSQTPAWNLGVAGVGDHALIQQLLQRFGQSPSDAEFLAQINHPEYAPESRLLVQHQTKIAAHVRCSDHLVAWDGQSIATTDLSELVTAPEFRSRGCATLLLQAADRRAARYGSGMLTMRTRIPKFFRRRGWLLGPRHSVIDVCAQATLAMLSEAKIDGRWTVRGWRQVERDALERLRDKANQTARGAVCRKDSHWAWLISRNATDNVYVVADSSANRGERGDWNQACDSIVGYAFVQGERVVEFVVDPQHPTARLKLLQRVCSDAVENGGSHLQIETAPQDQLQDTLRPAGANHVQVDVLDGWVNLVRVPNAARYLDTIRDGLFQRVVECDVPRPCELGLAFETQSPSGATSQEKVCIAVARNCVQIVTGRLGRSYLSGPRETLLNCLLGRTTIDEAIASDKLRASTRAALELAHVLLPSQRAHRPPLDDLPARD